MIKDFEISFKSSIYLTVCLKLTLEYLILSYDQDMLEYDYI